MFGDYYTNDLISASPKTSMLGNEINLFVLGGNQQPLGASLVLVLISSSTREENLSNATVVSRLLMVSSP